MKQVQAVAVVGYKNTGKTTLITRLVCAFKAEGLRVGTCKHDGAHDFAIDAPGTDTWQHREAGADVTLIASRTHAALQQFYEQEPPLATWLETLSDPKLGLDLILVEGWKHSSLPKIVLLGNEKFEKSTNVVAYLTDGLPQSIADPTVPVYDRNEITALVQLIKAFVLHIS